MNINVYIYGALKLLKKIGCDVTPGGATWSLIFTFSNGDGVVEDRLVLRFIAIPAFLKSIPLRDTC